MPKDKLKQHNFRNIVRSRDKWVCQKCGSVEYVQAHHIDPVKDYPLFANLPDNGITLCVYCHADAHPEVPRGLFIANVIKAEKEGCISAGKLAKELDVNPRTIVRRAVKLGILKPMQKWMFTEEEAKLIRQYKKRKETKVKIPKQKKSKEKGVSLIVTLTKEQSEWLKRKSQETHLSMSAIVRKLIEKEMKNENTKQV